jgi:hypothetical protein
MITGRKRRSFFPVLPVALVGLLMGLMTGCGAAPGSAEDEAQQDENGAQVKEEEHAEIEGAVLTTTAAMAAIPQGGNNPGPCAGPCEPQPSPWRPTNPNANPATTTTSDSPGAAPQPSPWTPPGVPSPNQTNANSPNNNLAAQ